MKYIVMECRGGYAVLMDEASRCVYAANLHYTVGQTVTDPVLMRDDLPHQQIGMTRKIVMRCAAAAACLLLIGGGITAYYCRNVKTRSTILVSSDLNFMIELNSRGKVVCIKSDQPDASALLDQYDGKNKSKLDAIHDLLALQKEHGLLEEGETVNLFITAEDDDDYSAYKSELEQDMLNDDVNINVQPIEQYAVSEATAEKPALPVPEAPAEPPAPKDPVQGHPQPAEDVPPAPPVPAQPPKNEPAKDSPKDAPVPVDGNDEKLAPPKPEHDKEPPKDAPLEPKEPPHDSAADKVHPVKPPAPALHPAEPKLAEAPAVHLPE